MKKSLSHDPNPGVARAFGQPTRTLAPHVQASVAAVQPKAQGRSGPVVAPHVREAIASASGSPRATVAQPSLRNKLLEKVKGGSKKTDELSKEELSEIKKRKYRIQQIAIQLGFQLGEKAPKGEERRKAAVEIQKAEEEGNSNALQDYISEHKKE